MGEFWGHVRAVALWVTVAIACTVAFAGFVVATDDDDPPTAIEPRPTTTGTRESLGDDYNQLMEDVTGSDGHGDPPAPPDQEWP